jgi:hypothetical protein
MPNMAQNVAKSKKAKKSIYNKPVLKAQNISNKPVLKP